MSILVIAVQNCKQKRVIGMELFRFHLFQFTANGRHFRKSGCSGFGTIFIHLKVGSCFILHGKLGEKLHIYKTFLLGIWDEQARNVLLRHTRQIRLAFAE